MVKDRGYFANEKHNEAIFCILVDNGELYSMVNSPNENFLLYFQNQQREQLHKKIQKLFQEVRQGSRSFQSH